MTARKRKILFIDRDGTLIIEPPDEQVDSLEKLGLVPGVIPALLDLKEAGYEFVIVSNQDGLGTESYPFEDFEARLGLPREILLPYLERTCRNTATSGGGALTGSLARGDRATTERDLRALDGDPYAEVFRAFTRVYGLEEVKK